MLEAKSVAIESLARTPRQFRIKQLPGGSFGVEKVAVTLRQKEREIAFGHAIGSAARLGYEFDASNIGLLFEASAQVASARRVVMQSNYEKFIASTGIA